MIDPETVRPFAWVAVQDAVGGAPLLLPVWWCDRERPEPSCDVLHRCCRLPHDSARHARRLALTFARPLTREVRDCITGSIVKVSIVDRAGVELDLTEYVR